MASLEIFIKHLKNIKSLQTLPKYRKEGNIPQCILYSQIILIPKPGNDTKREKCRLLCLMNINAKKNQQHGSKLDLAIY